MQRPSYALALLLASLASCMVIANVAQCQVIVVFHDVSEGTDEPSATIIDSGSNASAADSAADDGAGDQSNSTDSEPSSPDTLPVEAAEEAEGADGAEGALSGDAVISEEPAVPSESPVQAEIDAGIEGNDSIYQPYHVPEHSRVCPYAGDWLDYGLRDYSDRSGNDLKSFSTEPTLDERVADVPAPATEVNELRSAEIQAVEEDVINDLASDQSGSIDVDGFDSGTSRQAALRLATTLDHVGNWFHQVSGGIRAWANADPIRTETSVDANTIDENTVEENAVDGYSADENVDGETVTDDESYFYDESVDMTEQLE